MASSLAEAVVAEVEAGVVAEERVVAKAGEDWGGVGHYSIL